MARPLRVEYEGAIYHVTVRGNGRRAIFLDNRDRQRFLARLADCVEADRPENGTGGLLKKSIAANHANPDSSGFAAIGGFFNSPTVTIYWLAASACHRHSISIASP